MKYPLAADKNHRPSPVDIVEFAKLESHVPVDQARHEQNDRAITTPSDRRSVASGNDALHSSISAISIGSCLLFAPSAFFTRASGASVVDFAICA